MFRLLICIVLCVFYVSPFSLFAGEGYIGENPGLNFYSRIDETASLVSDGILKKRLSEYSTFSNFWSYCRSPSPWFDSTRMEKRMLDEIWNGYYGTIISIAEKKRVSLSNESMQNLVECLRDAYSEIQKWSLQQYESLSTMWSMWLYMDGNTANSDYDIVADVEKINALIFTEELKYNGTKNMGKKSLSNLISGKKIAPLVTPKAKQEIDVILGNTGATEDSWTEWDNWWDTETLWSLWIWTICSLPNETTSVTNMADEVFLEELALALEWGDRVVDWGGSYNPRDLLNQWWSWISAPTNTSAWDFFQTPRCTTIFCIKFGTVNGSDSLLGGSKNNSIETILDKHIKLVEPKSVQNSWLQKMSSNTMELPCTGLACNLKSMVKWWTLKLTEKTWPKDRYKEEETKEKKDAKLEQALRCWLFSAWLASSDMNVINSVKGAAFINRAWSNTENIQNTALPISPNEPDEKDLAGCMSLTVENGRNSYYWSFSDDLSEIETFSKAMIKLIEDILKEGEKIDKLKTV